ncbi:MAG TPA: hypothetical protein VEQ18_03120, partial [Candidatus Nitrosocosmicus sp.]|nr:hypothetical protein [Candidatus Nitrosocosmicus sp.]
CFPKECPDCKLQQSPLMLGCVLNSYEKFRTSNIIQEGVILAKKIEVPTHSKTHTTVLKSYVQQNSRTRFFRRENSVKKLKQRTENRTRKLREGCNKPRRAQKMKQQEEDSAMMCAKQNNERRLRAKIERRLIGRED